MTSIMLLSQVLETPYRATESDLEPCLFDSHLRPEGHGSFVGTLIEGVTFSNGDPLLAQDVVGCFSRAALLSGLKCSALDERSVRFDDIKDPRALERLLSHRRAVVWKHDHTRILGSGPFVFGEIAPELINFTRNPLYRRPVSLERLEVRVFHESVGDDDLAGAVETGEIDLTFELSRDEAQKMKGVRKLFGSGDSTAMLFMNADSSLLSSSEARRAVAGAIDRHALAAASYDNPVAYIARGLLPPMIGRSRAPAERDPVASREWFAAHPPARPLVMARVWGPRAYLPKPEETALAIERQLALVGVAIEHRATRDPDDYFDVLLTGNYDLVLGGWVADTPEASDFLESLLASKMVPSRESPAATSCNLGRWRDPKTDDLLARYRETSDASLLEALEDHLAEQRPLLPLMHGPCVAVHTWRVHGFEWTSRSCPDFTNIQIDAG